MRLISILLTTALLACSVETAARVQLRSRSGYTGQAGQRFRFYIGIERDARNRAFCLQWASEASEGSSCDTLEGDKAPRVIWREVTFRTGGEFNVIAWVTQADGTLIKSNIETIRLLDRWQ